MVVSRSVALALAAAVLVLAAYAEASLHDGSRGFKTARTPQYKVDEYMKHRHPDSVLHRMKNKDKLLEHPDVQKFMEWRSMHKAGHPDAGPAYAGKLPHDFIPMLATLDEEDKRQEELAAQQAQQQASDAGHVEL